MSTIMIEQHIKATATCSTYTNGYNAKRAIQTARKVQQSFKDNLCNSTRVITEIYNNTYAFVKAMSDSSDFFEIKVFCARLMN